MSDEPPEYIHKFILYGILAVPFALALAFGSVLCPAPWNRVGRWSGYAVLATALLLMWIGHRETRRIIARQRESRCVHCGYDLRGSPDRCPECGAKPDAP